jgi:hypothetical protein
MEIIKYLVRINWLYRLMWKLVNQEQIRRILIGKIKVGGSSVHSDEFRKQLELA